MTVRRWLRPTILDRYIVREMLSPTGVGLLLFTFILLLNQIALLTGVLISKGADFPTVIRVFVYFLPSVLAITIPMSFLLGVLLAFGRLASESEIVALRSVGVSALTLLRPVVAMATLATLVTFWIFAVAVPEANTAYRQIMFSLIINKARTAIKPRVFTDDLVPGMVFYISDIDAGTQLWKDVFINDSRLPERPRTILARSGRLVIDEPHKSVALHLERGAIHSIEPRQPEVHEEQRFVRAEIPLPFEQFFPNLTLSKGDREMRLDELASMVRKLRTEGKPDWVRYAVEWHKKFSLPFACVVFGLLGLGLSLGSKKEARSAAFGLSIAVIFIYYVIIRLGEQAGDTGLLPPGIAVWGANLLLGTIAVVLLVLNHREAAFDPLDLTHYAAWIPRIRRQATPAPARVPTVTPAGTARRKVYVVKVPRLALGFPGILDRYVGRAFVGHLVLVLAAFLSFTLLGEFLDLFDDVQQNHVKGRVVVHYFLFHAPALLYLLVPFGVLVATLTTFGILSRRNEITAMKAGGVSVYRVAVPVLALAVLGSLLVLTQGEFLLPNTNQIAAQDFNVIKGRPPQSSNLRERRWILGSDGRLYNYEWISDVPASRGSPAEFSLNNLSIYDVEARSWTLRERFFANRATWNGIAYDLEKGWRRSFGDKGAFQAFAATSTREIEPPGYFRREERESYLLSFTDLRTHIASLEAKGLDVTVLRVQLHRKLSTPAQAMVMVLIGIPFAFVVGRRGALYGIGISVLIAIVYWACIGIFDALGNNALLPPLLAAWAPNLLFAGVGLYLALTVET